MSAFDDFFNAIAGQESGGNYRAVNRDSGALGKYQIMPANIPAWSQKYLGYKVTASQFLNSSSLQDILARAVLQNYYNSYGARGAAAAWYSGNPNKANDYHKQGNYPSIGEYADQVLARMGQGDFGYAPTPTKVTDNRVKDSALKDLVPQETEKLDALSGIDRNALGLQEVNGTGLDAATGGAGTEAPTVTAPTTTQAAPKAAVGDTFKAHWEAADAQAADGLRGTVVDLASHFVGTPYVWGGAGPGGFDCSGLIQYAMKQAGLSIPRVSWEQLAMGQKTDIGSLQAGDLVGFRDGTHVALYLGNGQILEAPRAGLDVRIRSLGKNENAWGVSLADLYK